MSDMSVFNDARTALRTQLLAVVGLPAARKWDGESLDPSSFAPYIRETLLRKAPPKRQTIGAQPRMELVVLYQIDLYEPVTNVNGTTNTVAGFEQRAGAIAAAFPTTRDLASGSVRVHIRSAGLAKVQESTPHNWISITIEAVVSYWADQ